MREARGGEWGGEQEALSVCVRGPRAPNPLPPSRGSQDTPRPIHLPSLLPIALTCPALISTPVRMSSDFDRRSRSSSSTGTGCGYLLIVRGT